METCFPKTHDFLPSYSRLNWIWSKVNKIFSVFKATKRGLLRISKSMKLSYRSVLYSFQKWSICSPQGTRNRIDLLQRWKRRCFEAPHRIFIFLSLSRFSWLATATSPVANHTLRFSAPPLDFPGRLSLHRRSYFTTVIHNWSGKYAHLSIYGWTDKIGFLTLFISQKRNWFSASYILGRQTIFDNFLGEYVMRLQRISPLFWWQILIVDKIAPVVSICSSSCQDWNSW